LIKKKYNKTSRVALQSYLQFLLVSVLFLVVTVRKLVDLDLVSRDLIEQLQSDEHNLSDSRPTLVFGCSTSASPTRHRDSFISCCGCLRPWAVL